MSLRLQLVILLVFVSVSVSQENIDPSATTQTSDIYSTFAGNGDMFTCWSHRIQSIRHKYGHIIKKVPFEMFLSLAELQQSGGQHCLTD